MLLITQNITKRPNHNIKRTTFKGTPTENLPNTIFEKAGDSFSLSNENAVRQERIETLYNSLENLSKGKRYRFPTRRIGNVNVSINQEVNKFHINIEQLKTGDGEFFFLKKDGLTADIRKGEQHINKLINYVERFAKTFV